MAVTESERRNNPRVDVAWKAAVGTVHDTDLLSSRTHDVSVAGACVRGPLEATVGDELVVQLSVQDRTIPAMAQVVASRPVGDEVELRLRFSWLSAVSRDALHQSVLQRALLPG